MSPIDVADRNSFNTLQLTSIGKFGIIRKARPNVPAHMHTGIDVRRPGRNYVNEPIFPVAKGVVISKRDDGPYAQVMVEHKRAEKIFWTLYEHIAGINVDVGDEVDPLKPIARFMNKEELNRYGWQFDHVHLEVLKVKPRALKPDRKNPTRFFNSYTLECHTPDALDRHFYEPLTFLRSHAH